MSAEAANLSFSTRVQDLAIKAFEGVARLATIAPSPDAQLYGAAMDYRIQLIKRLALLAERLGIPGKDGYRQGTVQGEREWHEYDDRDLMPRYHMTMLAPLDPDNSRAPIETSGNVPGGVRVFGLSRGRYGLEVESFDRRTPEPYCVDRIEVAATKDGTPLVIVDVGPTVRGHRFQTQSGASVTPETLLEKPKPEVRKLVFEQRGDHAHLLAIGTHEVVKGPDGASERLNAVYFLPFAEADSEAGLTRSKPVVKIQTQSWSGQHDPLPFLSAGGVWTQGSVHALAATICKQSSYGLAADLPMDGTRLSLPEFDNEMRGLGLELVIPDREPFKLNLEGADDIGAAAQVRLTELAPVAATPSERPRLLAAGTPAPPGA